MKNKIDRWTEQELAILRNGMPGSKQLPLLPGRTLAAVLSKKTDLNRKEATKVTARKQVKEELKSDAYKGQKVELYQPIRVADATPARVKVWKEDIRKRGAA